jgi:MFS transporter, SHS family, sialic acid transporter
MTQTQPSSISVRSLMAGVGAWFGAGIPMGLGPLIGLPAANELLAKTTSASDIKGVAGAWVGYWVAAFLLGGACGGWCFGVLGDRFGRVRTLAASIICYSAFTLLSAVAISAEQMLVLRFLAGLGVGGAWPVAASLVAEAWPRASRPLAAGVLGAAANLGILIIALAGGWIDVSAWRTVTLVSAAPIVFAAWVWAAVPESAKWLESRESSSKQRKGSTAVVFGSQYLGRTSIGILVATVPLVGAWASGKWIMPWAQSVVGSSAPTQQAWAAGAVIGAAAGGWLANQFGRRATYFAISLLTLGLNLVIYTQLTPASPLFRGAVFVLGLVATVFFGWLPLYLPELFPTEIRATGTGVTFNFGRFITVGCVLGASELLRSYEGDYGRVGAATAWVYALGMIVILLAPDLSQPRSVTTREST